MDKKNCVKLLISVQKMNSKRLEKGKLGHVIQISRTNSCPFAIKTCDGITVTSCRHPHINILVNIANDDLFSKIQTILCLSLFKLQLVRKELKKKKIRTPFEICYLSSIPVYLWVMIRIKDTLKGPPQRNTFF